MSETANKLTCEKCKYFKPDAKNMQVGTCHRFPPSLFALPMQGPMGQIDIQTNAYSVPVNRKNWCGEFKQSIMEAGQ